MNICIIGDGLTSLSLAKNLIKKKINVHIYQKDQIKKLSLSRTIGISKKNLGFIKKKICDVPKKYFWEIRKIKIFIEDIEKENILKFEDNKNILFYMVKNDYFYKLLNNKLLKNKFFNRTIIQNHNFYEELLKKNKYDLIINCDPTNFFSKKYFTKKINKDYYNHAYTTILKHDKIYNNTAIQNFTKFGPIAFLPISNTETSVVSSLDTKNKKFLDKEVINLINVYNPKYKIKKFSPMNNFKLSSSNPRKYYHKNILSFGDSLHKIHPLAGQGFNMTIRDIKTLSEIIDNRMDLGLNLDSSICNEFEKKTKHKNYIFVNGIDFIYEFFNFDKKILKRPIIKFLKFFDKSEKLKNIFIKLADKGINI